MSDMQQTITIDEVEYKFDDLNDQAKFYIAHVQDLDRKIQKAQFDMDQLRYSRDAFFGGLKLTLGNPATQ